MSSFLSELGGITAGVGAEGLAFAAGFAASHALEPEAVTIRQDAWNAAKVLRIPPEVAAEIAAENISSYPDMSSEAGYYGWDDSRFAYLYHLNLVAPGTGELLNMLRRGTINSGNFTHGLRKNKYEPMWDTALAELANQYISATDLAYMIVRGVLPDEGTLPGSLPTQADNLQLPPQLNLNPVTEASKTGWNQERLAAMVARSGLAMAPGLAAQARFRKILTANDYLLTIARGDLFPAYADPMLEVSRQIPTAGEFMENALRGWRTKTEGENGAALHGMTQEHADLIYQNRRRPLNPHAIKQALARGAKFNPEAGEIQNPYSASVHQADLGPEWYEMAVALQGSYPPLFQVNRLVTAGIIDPATGADWMRKSGEADEVVTALEKYWGQAKPAAGDTHVAKAQTQLWSTTHRSYIANEISQGTATTALNAAGVAGAAIPSVLSLWNEERSLTRKALTATQIRKAVKSGATNPATGQPWTHAEAIQRLLELGYDQADAETFMEEA